ncbi:conserved hypothetical protein [Ricinus communis]|uniref:DUF4283 domain-containing protein n=1 Tax=Ricinus communis TaxID=3988 RepID=B9S105_RICCO|nr:conserved hypothetical protein [Ricinus communis]
MKDISLNLQTNASAAQGVTDVTLVDKIIGEKNYSPGLVQTIMQRVWNVSQMLNVKKRETHSSSGSLIVGRKESITSFWIQIHGLPLNQMTLENAKMIGGLFEGLEEVDLTPDNQICWNSYMRLKVAVRVDKPLLEGFSNIQDVVFLAILKALAQMGRKWTRLRKNREEDNSMLTVEDRQKEPPKPNTMMKSGMAASSVPSKFQLPKIFNKLSNPPLPGIYPKGNMQNCSSILEGPLEAPTHLRRRIRIENLARGFRDTNSPSFEVLVDVNGSQNPNSEEAVVGGLQPRGNGTNPNNPKPEGTQVETLSQSDLSFRNETKGLAGGLGLWWMSDVTVQVLGSCEYFIDTVIEGEHVCHATFVYRELNRSRRNLFWAELRKIKSADSNPWVCIGDFNALRRTIDKRGRRPVMPADCCEFQLFMEECDLKDMAFKGHWFTWSNK